VKRNPDATMVAGRRLNYKGMGGEPIKKKRTKKINEDKPTATLYWGKGVRKRLQGRKKEFVEEGGNEKG